MKYGNANDAALVKRAREALELNQDALGELLGVTQGAISHIETEDRALDYLARQEIERLLAVSRAEAIIEEERAVACNGQLLQTAQSYLRHLARCPKCMARAYFQRANVD